MCCFYCGLINKNFFNILNKLCRSIIIISFKKSRQALFSKVFFSHLKK